MAQTFRARRNRVATSSTSREDGEVERLLHVHGHQEHDHGAGDVEADQEVEDERGQRHDQHHDDGDHGGGDADQAEPVLHGTSVDDSGQVTGHSLAP